MDAQTYRELREALDAESISYGELALIEAAFEAIPDSFLRDARENAMASDMLDEIGAFYGLLAPFDAVDTNDELLPRQPFCQEEPDDGGTLCELLAGHGGAHRFSR